MQQYYSRYGRIVLGAGIILASFFGAFFVSSGRVNSLVITPVQSEAPRIAGEAPTHIARPSLENNTEKTAREIVERILEKNPDGPDAESLSLLAPAPNEVVNTALAGRVEEITETLLEPVIDTDAFIITEENTPASYSAYFSRRNAIMQASSVTLTDEVLATLDVHHFIEISENLSVILDSLRVTTVPSALLEIHTEQVRLITIQRGLFDAIANYEDDALAAWLAISLLETLDPDFLLLSEAITDFILTNDVVIYE